MTLGVHPQIPSPTVHTHTLTVELPAADMRPPGSISYPVQASRQLHGAKQVPVYIGQSPIKEQHPSSPAHPQDRHTLQGISGAHVHPSEQLTPVKTNNSLCLQPVLYTLGESCCGARLNFPSTA